MDDRSLLTEGDLAGGLVHEIVGDDEVVQERDVLAVAEGVEVVVAAAVVVVIERDQDGIFTIYCMSKFYFRFDRKAKFYTFATITNCFCLI